MATDRQVGSKTPDWSRRDSVPGTRVDSGPYVGIVKSALDPIRAGRLQVYIPDLGGEPDNPQSWIMVNYASPFFGSTTQPLDNKLNQFDKTEHTYGMWFVPPDVGNEVLITFVAGKPDKGYWFACVNPGLSHYMVPGLAAAKNLNKNNVLDPDVKKALSDKSVLPAAEFNKKDPALSKSSTFLKNPRPVHEYQAKVLIKQGLDTDAVRGAISSSSQREVPCSVFGISTPGRPLGAADTAADYTAYANKLNDNKLTEKDFAVAARKGGHTFIMDDGDAAGNDQLIRLRTSGGHQILMNDKERIMYISNSEGSVWIELSGSGHMHIYSSAGVNIRTQGDFNLHSDQNVNINAGGSINLLARKNMVAEAESASIFAQNQLTMFGSDVGVGSNGSLKLSASSTASIKAGGALDLVGSTINLNTNSANSVAPPTKIKNNSLSDTQLDQTTGTWVSSSSGLTSIATVAPTHEPWSRQGATTASAASTTSTATSTSAATPTPTPALISTPTPTSAAAPTKEPCTLTDPAKSSAKSINAGTAPQYIIETVACGANKDQPLDPGPKKADGQPVVRRADKSLLTRTDAPNPSDKLGPLSPIQVKALMTQLAWSESGLDYAKREIVRGNYLGRYQFGADALATLGYIKQDYLRQYKTKAVTYGLAWTGKDQIRSLQDWLRSPGTQEKVMFQYLTFNYKRLIDTGAIKKGDDVCTIAGMLATAHLLGAGGAKIWRNTGLGRDQNQTAGETYYNMGRYAIDFLAKAFTEAVSPAPQTTPAVAAAVAAPTVTMDKLDASTAQALDLFKKKVTTGQVYNYGSYQAAIYEVVRSATPGATAAAQAAMEKSLKAHLESIAVQANSGTVPTSPALMARAIITALGGKSL